MIRRCGGWVEPKHPPLIMGEREPLDDRSYTDTTCKACWLELTAQVKAGQMVRLTAYMRRGRTLSVVVDRLGAALRLKFVRHLEDFMGHNTEAAAR